MKSSKTENYLGIIFSKISNQFGRLSIYLIIFLIFGKETTGSYSFYSALIAIPSSLINVQTQTFYRFSNQLSVNIKFNWVLWIIVLKIFGVIILGFYLLEFTTLVNTSLKGIFFIALASTFGTINYTAVENFLVANREHNTLKKYSRYYNFSLPVIPLLLLLSGYNDNIEIIFGLNMIVLSSVLFVKTTLIEWKSGNKMRVISPAITFELFFKKFKQYGFYSIITIPFSYVKVNTPVLWAGLLTTPSIVFFIALSSKGLDLIKAIISESKVSFIGIANNTERTDLNKKIIDKFTLILALICFGLLFLVPEELIGNTNIFIQFRFLELAVIILCNDIMVKILKQNDLKNYFIYLILSDIYFTIIILLFAAKLSLNSLGLLYLTRAIVGFIALSIGHNRLNKQNYLI